LAEIAGSPFTSPQLSGNGGPLAVSADGKFLFYSDSIGDITAFFVSDGVLTPTGASVYDPNSPAQFAVDPSGKYLYVSNGYDSSAGDQFSVFAIDPSTGVLSAIAGSPFHFQGNSQPRGIGIHPSGNLIFAALSNSSSVEGLRVDRATGALSLISGSPWNTELGPKYVALTPSGSFLYVSTSGAGSIDPYSINQQTGALTALSRIPGGDPAQMVTDAAGKVLYVSFPGLNQVAAYPINQASGQIPGQPLIFPAGSFPGALAIVQLP